MLTATSGLNALMLTDCARAWKPPVSRPKLAVLPRGVGSSCAILSGTALKFMKSVGCGCEGNVIEFAVFRRSFILAMADLYHPLMLITLGGLIGWLVRRWIQRWRSE